MNAVLLLTISPQPSPTRLVIADDSEQLDDHKDEPQQAESTYG
jgi:hypothetical protein